MELVQWHWLVLALVLIGLEALGTGGFLVGAAIASFFMALLVHFTPISWEWQVISFAILSVIATTIFWVFFKRSSDNEPATLNDRGAQMVGTTLILSKTLQSPQDKLQIGDTFWKVSLEEDLEEGTKVTVVGSQNMILALSPID